MKKVSMLILCSVIILSLSSCATTVGSRLVNAGDYSQDETQQAASTETEDISSQKQEQDQFETQEQQKEQENQIQQEENDIIEIDLISFEGILAEPYVLYNDNDVIITLSSVQTYTGDLNIFISVGNNRNEYLYVRTNDTVINGVFINMSSSCRVESKRSIDSFIYVSAEDLNNARIEVIQYIELNLYLFVPDNDEDFISDRIRIRLNDDKNYIQSINDDGVEVYNEYGIRIVVTDIKHKRSYNSVRLFVENTSDRDIDVYFLDCSVNGFKIDALFILYTDNSGDSGYQCFTATGMKSKSSKYTNFLIFEYSLEDYGIEQIDMLAFSVMLEDKALAEQIDEPKFVAIDYTRYPPMLVDYSSGK